MLIRETGLQLIRFLLLKMFTKSKSVRKHSYSFLRWKRQTQIIANLKKSVESNGAEVPVVFEKGITLSTIDDLWKEQLREMDELKQSVQNASYEQKDPLLIYKFESFELFKKMIQKLIRILAHI